MLKDLKADRLSKYALITISNPEKFDERVFVEYLLQKLRDLKMIEIMPIEIAPQEDIPNCLNAQTDWDSWMTSFLD